MKDKEKWVEVQCEQRGDVWRWPVEPGAPSAVLEGACVGCRQAQTRFGPVQAYDFVRSDGRKVTVFAKGRLNEMIGAVLRAKGEGIVMRIRFLGWTDVGGGRRKREFGVSYLAE